MKMVGDFVTSNPKITFGMLVTVVGGLVTLLWGKNWEVDEKGRTKAKSTSHHKVTRIKGGNVEIKTQTSDTSHQEVSYVDGKDKVSIETRETTAVTTTLQFQPQNNATPATQPQPQNNTTPTTPPTIEKKEEKKDEPGKTLSGSSASFLNNLSPPPPPTPSLDSQMPVVGK